MFKSKKISFDTITVQAKPVRTLKAEALLHLVLENGLKIEVAGGFNPSILQKLIRTAEAL